MTFPSIVDEDIEANDCALDNIYNGDFKGCFHTLMFYPTNILTNSGAHQMLGVFSMLKEFDVLFVSKSIGNKMLTFATPYF